MQRQSATLGAIYTTLAMAAVAVMAAIVKWASLGFSSELLMVVRWGAGLLMFLVVHAVFHRDHLRSEKWRTQTFVAISWTLSIFLYYVSVRFIPLMDATLLLSTSALFAPILSLVFDHKREPRLVWIGSAIGFAGVLVVLKPGAGMFQPMALLALAAGLLMALRIFLNSRLHDEPKQRTTFYSLAIGLAVCLLLLAASGFSMQRPDWEKMLFTPTELTKPWFVDSALTAAVVWLGILALAQPFFIAWSLQYASVGQIAPFRYTTVIIAAAIDWAVWGVVPTWTSLGGMVLVAIGAMFIIGSRNKSKPPPSQPAAASVSMAK